MELISDIFILLINCIPYFFGFLSIALALWLILYSIIEFVHDIYFGFFIWLDILWLIAKIIFAIMLGCFGMTFIIA